MTNIEEIFEKSGAILKGHFLLTSGLHSPVYWEKIRVLQHPAYVEQLCRIIADHFPTGGIILAFEVARQLGVRAAYAEKEPTGERVFRRGSGIEPDEKVLIVDDIMTKGGSIEAVMSAVAKEGGVVVGIGILVDRSEDKIDFGVPLFSCHRVATIPTYTPENCPLCAEKVPLTKPGGK